MNRRCECLLVCTTLQLPEAVCYVARPVAAKRAVRCRALGSRWSARGRLVADRLAGAGPRSRADQRGVVRLAARHMGSGPSGSPRHRMVVKRSTPRRGRDGVRDQATVGAWIRREPPLALFVAPDVAMADLARLAPASYPSSPSSPSSRTSAGVTPGLPGAEMPDVGSAAEIADGGGGAEFRERSLGFAARVWLRFRNGRRDVAGGGSVVSASWSPRRRRSTTSAGLRAGGVSARAARALRRRSRAASP